MPSNKDDGLNLSSTGFRHLVAEFEALDDEFAETYDRFARPFCDGATDKSDESVPHKLTGFSFEEYKNSNSNALSTASKKAESTAQAPDILDLDSFKFLKSESDFKRGVSLRKNSRRPKRTGNSQNKTVDRTDKTVPSNKVTRGKRRKSKREVLINCSSLANSSAVNVPFIRPEDCKNRKNRLLICKLCNAGFVDVTSLCQHVLLHQQRPKQEPGKANSKEDSPQEVGLKFRCGLCFPKREFDSGVQLKEHVAANHKSTRLGFACGQCKKKFTTVDAFQGHVLNVHGTRNQGTERSQVPIGGTRSKQREFVCEKCGEAFKKTAALEWHIKEVHEFSLPFECVLCKSRFRTESGRSKHQRVAHFVPEVSKCTECAATFHAEEELKAHVEKQHQGLRKQKEGPRLFDFCMNPVADKTVDTAKTSYFLEEANQFSLFGSDLITDPAKQVSRVLRNPKIPARKPSLKKLVTVNGEKIVQLSLQKLIAIDYRILDGFTPIDTARNAMITFASTKRISAERQDFLARLADARPDEIPPIPPSFRAKVRVEKNGTHRVTSSDSSALDLLTPSVRSTLLATSKLLKIGPKELPDEEQGLARPAAFARPAALARPTTLIDLVGMEQNVQNSDAKK